MSQISAQKVSHHVSTEQLADVVSEMNFVTVDYISSDGETTHLAEQLSSEQISNCRFRLRYVNSRSRVSDNEAF